MDYGVTDKGFVLKRLDVITEEVHQDLTTGFGFDTRLHRPSFLQPDSGAVGGRAGQLLCEIPGDSYRIKPGQFCTVWRNPPGGKQENLLPVALYR